MPLFSDNNGARADCRRPSTSAGVVDPLEMVGISPNHFCQFVFIALFCVLICNVCRLREKKLCSNVSATPIEQMGLEMG